MMDDLISRQAAIDELQAKKDKSAKGDIGCFYNVIIQNDIDALKALPSAQPEIIHCDECRHSQQQKAISVKRHGKWIPRISTGNIALIECSECKFHYPEVLGTFSFYYCPNCGAKMNKGDEDE